MARIRAQHLDAVTDTFDATVHFGQRVLQGLAAFTCGLQGNRLATGADQFGCTVENLHAGDLRQPAFAIPEQRIGSGQGCVDILGSGNGYLANQAVVVGGIHRML
ncbi:hypothetical protein D3C85_1511180 [compost metagenome]